MIIFLTRCNCVDAVNLLRSCCYYEDEARIDASTLTFQVNRLFTAHLDLLDDSSSDSDDDEVAPVVAQLGKANTKVDDDQKLADISAHGLISTVCSHFIFRMQQLNYIGGKACSRRCPT